MTKSSAPELEKLADEWRHLVNEDSSEWHDGGKTYVTIAPTKSLLNKTIKSLEASDERLDELRKRVEKRKAGINSYSVLSENIHFKDHISDESKLEALKGVAIRTLEWTLSEIDEVRKKEE